MKQKEVKIDDLQTVKNYADTFGITAAYIYKLEKEQKMDLFLIDGVKFVDTSKYPTIPVQNRRK